MKPDNAVSSEDERVARVAELERRLFSRSSAPARLETEDDDAHAARQAKDLAELEALKIATVPGAHDAEGSVSSDADRHRVSSGALGLVSISPTEASPSPLHVLSRSDRTSRTRRRALIVATVTMAVGFTSAFLLVATTPSPAGLDSLARKVTPLDRERSDVLRDAGLPLVDDGRVLARLDTVVLVGFRAPGGTAQRLQADDVGSAEYTALQDQLPEPSLASELLAFRSEVCAWVIADVLPVDGRCVSLDQFAADGIQFDIEAFGSRFDVAWAGSGVVDPTVVRNDSEAPPPPSP